MLRKTNKRGKFKLITNLKENPNYCKTALKNCFRLILCNGFGKKIFIKTIGIFKWIALGAKNF